MFPQARTENLLVQEIGHELIIYDQENHQAHRLNSAAALVWNHCNGQTSVDELSALLQSRLGLPPDEEIAWMALDHLRKAYLLEVPVEEVRISRRKLVQKLGLAGGISLLMPVVTSMVAPTPAIARGYPATCCEYRSSSGGVSRGCAASGGCQPPPVGTTLVTTAAGSCDACPK